MNISNKPFFLALSLFVGGVIIAVVLIFSGAEQNSDVTSRAFTSGLASKIGSAQRIICGSPSITEIVFALGEGERVVGVSQFSSYPPEAKKRANIGGLINPDKERILSLQPDLFLTQGKNETLIKFCQENEIGFLSLSIENIQDLEQAILFIGNKLDAEENADQLINQMRKTLNNIRLKVAERPKKKVLLTLGHRAGDLSGLISVGPDTFLNELIEVAGGVNIFTDSPVRYPQISKESLILRDPDVIIEVFTERLTDSKKKRLKQDWGRLESLSAVRTENIHLLDHDFFLIPGTRIGQTAAFLSELLHPEANHD